MAGGTTQATAAYAVRRKRLDTTQRTVWVFSRAVASATGAFLPGRQEWAGLVPDHFDKRRPSPIASH